MQRVAGGDEIVALCLQKIETLRFFGVLFDGECVHRSNGVDGAPQPVVFLSQPLEVAFDLRCVGQQLVERLAPLGLDALDEPAFPAFDLRALELQPVLFFAQGGQRLARLIERAFRLADVGVDHTHLRFGVLRGGGELRHCQTALLQRVLPLRALRRQ